MWEVRRLSEVKKKNESALSAEDLAGKYKNAYEKLCADLKEKQCELRARYMDAIREFSEVVSESVYLDPDTCEQVLHDRMIEKAENNKNGSFLKILFYIFIIFYCMPKEDGDENKTRNL